MSRIPDIGKNFERLPAVLAEYDEHIEEAHGILAVKGKSIESALKEQTSWVLFYDERRRELNTLVKYIAARVASTRGDLTRQYTENYSRDLAERVKERYIDNEDDYLKMYEIQLEVQEMLEKYEAIVDAFRVRGFALRDITTLRVHSIQDGTL